MSEYFSDDGDRFDSVREYVWISVLEFCGCYNDELFEKVFAVLMAMYEAKSGGTVRYYDGTILEELILHVLTSKELCEHGTGVRGSWLTDKGVELCKLIADADKPKEQT